MITIIGFGLGLHILNCLLHNMKECPPGLQGPKGDTGPQGPKGDAGLQRPKGDTVIAERSNGRTTTQLVTPQKPKKTTVLEDAINNNNILSR